MNAKWYLARPGGAAVGPLRTDVLVHRIRSGTISREALVWCQGMPKWLPLASVTELADAVRTDPGPRVGAVEPAGLRRDPRQEARRDPPVERAPFQEDDADEKTELAIPGSFPEVPSSAEPTVLRPAPTPQEQKTLAIIPGVAPNAYSESWAWQAAKVEGRGYELPDSATKVVNPRPGPTNAPTNSPMNVQQTLPAAGMPAKIIPGLAGTPVAGVGGVVVAPAREQAPTRIGAFNPLAARGAPLPQANAAPVAGASVAAAYPAQSPEASPADDGVPPPYPPGFPGPDVKPPLPLPPPPAASAEQDPVELPMAKTTTATRLAVAVVFILGLALGIFGARRVVMMRQAAQENHASP
jgi:GYF domain 2